jgi:hypothetical protein
MKRPSLQIIFIFISFFVIVGLACGTSTQTDPTATTSPEEQVEEVVEPVVVEEVVEEAEVMPTATDPPMRQMPPAEEAAPVEEVEEEPVAEPQAFYVEEFDGDLSSWSYFLMSGDESYMDLFIDYGRLVFDLRGYDQFVYLIYDEYIYDSVRIDVEAENLGKNTNSVSLVCNYSDRFGWYEFNISNGGLYDILVYSELDGGYFTLVSGGSKNVRIGRDVNTYTAICQGNKLQLFINGAFEREFTDTKYNLREGQVGVSVSSFDVLPILVELDYFAISQP